MQYNKHSDNNHFLVISKLTPQKVGTGHLLLSIYSKHIALQLQQNTSTKENNCHFSEHMNYFCPRSALGRGQSSDTNHLGLPERASGLACFPGETLRGRDGNTRRPQPDTSHCEMPTAVIDTASWRGDGDKSWLTCWISPAFNFSTREMRAERWICQVFYFKDIFCTYF